MTYDDWKLRSDRDERPEEEPPRCIHLVELSDHCLTCDGPEEGMPDHAWLDGVCSVCGRHREDEGIRGCNAPPLPAVEEKEKPEA